MDWTEFALLGAGGGAVVEVLAVFQSIAVWQIARRTPTGRVKSSPPRLREFLDLPAHAWIFPLRALLGAGAAALFGLSGQITGVVATVALGYAAPSVLAQLGNFPQVQALVTGTAESVTPPTVAAANPGTPADAEPQEAASGR